MAVFFEVFFLSRTKRIFCIIACIAVLLSAFSVCCFASSKDFRFTPSQRVDRDSMRYAVGSGSYVTVTPEQSYLSPDGSYSQTGYGYAFTTRPSSMKFLYTYNLPQSMSISSGNTCSIDLNFLSNAFVGCMITRLDVKFLSGNTVVYSETYTGSQSSLSRDVTYVFTPSSSVTISSIQFEQYVVTSTSTTEFVSSTLLIYDDIVFSIGYDPAANNFSSPNTSTYDEYFETEDGLMSGINNSDFNSAVEDLFGTDTTDIVINDTEGHFYKGLFLITYVINYLFFSGNTVVNLLVRISLVFGIVAFTVGLLPSVWRSHKEKGGKYD